MAVQLSYPGVYIEEFTPGAPIEGVGTSTAAFIGIAQRGPLNEPTKITSWDNFTNLFGKEPVQGTYLWYAVRGFFQNGGLVCYVVRASNGTYQAMTLNDRTAAPGRPIVNLRARQPGALGITVTIADAPLLSNVPIYRPRGVLQAQALKGAMEVSLRVNGTVSASDVANRFKPGDEVSFSVGTDRRVISRVSDAVVRFTQALSQTLAAGTTMRLANTLKDARMIRLRPSGPLPAGQLVPGTIVRVSQGANSDTQVVESVITEVLTEGARGGLGPVSYRVTFRTGLGIQLDLAPGAANAPTATSTEINMQVTLGTVNITYDRLSMDPSHPRYLIDVVNGDSGGLLTASLIEPPPPNSVANAIPRVGCRSGAQSSTTG